MKKLYALCALLLLSLIVAACGGGDIADDTATAPNYEDVVDASEVEDDADETPDDYAQEEIVEEGLAPLSATMVEYEFYNLILTFSEDIRTSITDTGILELFFTDEEFPRTRVIQIAPNTFLSTEFAEVAFDMDHTPSGDMQTFTVNGKDAYIRYFYDSGDNPFVLALIMGNRSIYAVNLATSPELFDFSHTYFLALLDNVSEIEVDTQMLYNEQLLNSLVRHTINLEFNEIIEMVDQYLDEENVTEGDIAFEIRELAERAQELLDQAFIYVDSFNGQITVYYPGVREISGSINVVPYIRPDSSSNIRFPRATFFLTVGFERNGWLFFDRTELRMTDDFIFWRNHDRTVRDTLGGRRIRESVTMEWGLTGANSGYMRRLEQQMDPETNHALRFINRREDNNFDVALSATEVRAVSTLAELYNLIGRLAREIPGDFLD